MLTYICLVRHGETNWNVLVKLQGTTDIPLNNRGKLQADECGTILNELQWDVIITSPLRRAKQTADIINNRVKVPIIEMAELKERNFGDAEGMTLKERRKRFPDKKYPNQEDKSSFHKRLKAGIQKINQKYPNGRVILVTHGAVINTILSDISKGKIGSGKTKLNNACLSNIFYHKNQWWVQDYNLVDHLSQEKNE
ncbi:MAG: histidine phosphatase family protein [Heyndrickxia sp.]